MNLEQAMESALWLYKKDIINHMAYLRLLEGIHKDVVATKKDNDHWSVDAEYKEEYEKNLALIQNEIEMEKLSSKSRLESIE